MKTYTIKLKHDNGNYTVTTHAHSVEVAVRNIMEAENCPLTAISKIKEKETMYKVVKIFRKSNRRQILERFLTESEAQRLVQQYPDSYTHMVVYYKQFQN